MVIPLEDASALNPVTAISLPMIMTTIHAETIPSSTRQIKAEVMRSLSAIGSKSWPKTVICFFLLAQKPSSISVRAASRKITKAINSLPSNGERRTNTNIGMTHILRVVRELGMFIF